MHRHRVDVDAGHRRPQPVQNLLGVESLCFAASKKWVTASAMKVPGAAGGVQHVLVQGVFNQFPHHGARQPVGSVVLPSWRRSSGGITVSYRMAATSGGASAQSNRSTRRARVRRKGSPPTSVGQVKKSDSTTPCSPVSL